MALHKDFSERRNTYYIRTQTISIIQNTVTLTFINLQCTAVRVQLAKHCMYTAGTGTILLLLGLFSVFHK